MAPMRLPKTFAIRTSTRSANQPAAAISGGGFLIGVHISQTADGRLLVGEIYSPTGKVLSRC